MRNGSDDDRTWGAFGAPPSVGVPESLDDSPFALGELVAALRRPADVAPGVAAAVTAASRRAPAPLVGVPGTRPARAADRRTFGDRRRATRDRRLAAVEADAGTPDASPAAPLPRAWRWFTSPRAVRVTPLGALAAAGIAVAAVFGLRRDAERREPDVARSSDSSPVTGEFAAARRDDAAAQVASQAPSTAHPRDTVVVTRFMLVAPGAKQVTLVGDFNHWDQQATPLVPVAAPGAKNGVWTVDLPLAPGRFSYAFLVDGQRWVADPTRPRAVGDDFGRPSSAVTVGGGEA